MHGRPGELLKGSSSSRAQALKARARIRLKKIAHQARPTSREVKQECKNRKGAAAVAAEAEKDDDDHAAAAAAVTRSLVYRRTKKPIEPGLA